MKTQKLTIPEFGNYLVELHYIRPIFKTMFHIKNANDANAILRKCMHQKQLDLRESFWVILLTNANRVLAVSNVAIGTSTSVMTNPKYIFQLALLSNASAILVAHVHPSGNLKVSKKDILETKKMRKIALLLDMTLLDHLIITSESFVSFVQEDIL